MEQLLFLWMGGVKTRCGAWVQWEQGSYGLQAAKGTWAFWSPPDFRLADCVQVFRALMHLVYVPTFIHAWWHTIILNGGGTTISEW